MRRKEREVTNPERIDEFLRREKICRLGFVDGGEVYIVPMNYGFATEEGRRVLYFHSAKEGRKAALVKESPRVGFEIDGGFELWEGKMACAFSAGYQSVIGNGVIRMVDGEENKKRALTVIMNHNVGEREWEFDANLLREVAVFRLEVTEISCKEHVRKKE